MKIHKEGTSTIIIALLLLVILNVGLFLWLPVALIMLFYLLLFASILVFSLILWFFRKPLREISIDKTKIYAPADGKVVAIEETMEDEFIKENRKQISIFMSPLNVHMNLYPVSGKVLYSRHHHGKYLVAWHPKSSVENERTTIGIEGPGQVKYVVKQIAGAMARRIVNYAREGQEINQGQELGFIKFGSRVDIFLPLDAEIKVNLNEKVTAGLSVIATIKYVK